MSKRSEGNFRTCLLELASCLRCRPKSWDKFENNRGACDESTKWANMLSPSCLVWVSGARKKLWLTDTLCQCSKIFRHPNIIPFLALPASSCIQLSAFDLISEFNHSQIFLCLVIKYSTIHYSSKATKNAFPLIRNFTLNDELRPNWCLLLLHLGRLFPSSTKLQVSHSFPGVIYVQVKSLFKY